MTFRWKTLSGFLSTKQNVTCWPFPDGHGTSDSLILTTLPIKYYLPTGRLHAIHWIFFFSKIYFVVMITPLDEIVHEILKHTATGTR